MENNHLPNPQQVKRMDAQKEQSTEDLTRTFFEVKQPLKALGIHRSKYPSTGSPKLPEVAESSRENDDSQWL